MKKITLLLFAFVVVFLANGQQNFEVITQKPTPGSAITIEYMPRNTVLQGVKDFEATAYLMEGKLPLARAIRLKQEGGIFRGTVKTNDTTRAVFFSFSKDDLQDNNNDAGYYTLLYDKKGNAMPGSYHALASGFSSYGGIWGLKRNSEKATELNKTEFANAASRSKFYNEYFAFLSQSKVEADKELLKAELAKHAEKKNLSESDLQRLKSFYTNTLKDKEKGQSILALIKERYPDGSWRLSEASNKFYPLKTLQEKEKLFTDVVLPLQPVNKDEATIVESMAANLARMHADSGNIETAKKYIGMIKSNSTKAQTLNSIAWKLAGAGINKKPLDVKTGLELSMQSLALINEEKKTLGDKPPYLTEKQYLKNLDRTYYSFSDTYATLLYHHGDHEQAYAMEKKAMEGYERKNLNMNEAFAFLTEKVKGTGEAQRELEKFFEEGKYTPAMKEQLQRLYLAGGNSEEQWTKYVSNLEEIAFNKLKAELAKSMINMPAPQFALKDMNGKEVALSALKGKIVIVDFWATWCGPCIASFPGMQKAVNKFKDNPDVVFLFIDTWENGDDRQQKVTDFIAKNKYTFQVLYDDARSKEGNDFVVVEQFKVEGIPTKFVIDRNSNIRFKSVGFQGNADALVNELTAMIDMVDADNGTLKKGF